MLIHVSKTDDQIVGKLGTWITNGAREEDSFVDAARRTEDGDWLKSQIHTYLTHFESHCRRLTVIIVTEEKQATRWRERLQIYSQQAATVCSEKGAFRSQIDFRLVTVHRIQSEVLHISRSPLRKLFS